MTSTGKFPDGKLTDDDEGELELTVGLHEGRVVIDFNHSVKWFALLPEGAIALAKVLIKHAKNAGN